MSKGRVLIVDDDRSVLKLFLRTLSGAGFDVTPATSGLEALQRMEQSEFDVVLSDLAMPKMDGLTLLGQMRAQSLEQPVILMLDAPDNGAAIRATELGAIQSLVKPITAALLQKTAVYAVELHRSRRISPPTPTLFTVIRSAPRPPSQPRSRKTNSGGCSKRCFAADSWSSRNMMPPKPY